MSKDDQIILGAPRDLEECGKSNKSAAIAREIGRVPVLAFGNSTGVQKTSLPGVEEPLQDAA